MVSTRATRTKNGCVSACGRLTSGRIRIICEGWAGSSENTMKLYTFDSLTQVGFATQRPTVLVVRYVTIWIYFSFLSRTIFSPRPLLHFSVKRSESAETLPHTTVKLQNTILEIVALVKLPWNFQHWNVSDIDHRQTSACCACSRCGTFHFAPSLVIVLWPYISGKDSPAHVASNTIFSLSSFVMSLFSLHNKKLEELLHAR